MNHDSIPGTHEPGFEEQRITQIAVPLGVKQLVGKHSAFVMGECRIMLAREPIGPLAAMLWHLSISCEDRHPTWDEIKTARYRLIPDNVTMGMLLPPRDEYVNVPQQDHVFHLHEIVE